MRLIVENKKDGEATARCLGTICSEVYWPATFCQATNRKEKAPRSGADLQNESAVLISSEENWSGCLPAGSGPIRKGMRGWLRERPPHYLCRKGRGLTRGLPDDPG